MFHIATVFLQLFFETVWVATVVQHFYLPSASKKITLTKRFPLAGSREHFNYCNIISSNERRFSQRCGEVKIGNVAANTEVSYPDQVKDLQAKVKQLENALQQIEQQKSQLVIQVEDVRKKHHLATAPRLLADADKEQCKACVQGLLQAAKSAISMPLSPDHDEDIQSILDKSQDELYSIIEKMDKQVLVELCAAMGGLVQSLYLEREKARQQLAKHAWSHDASSESTSKTKRSLADTFIPAAVTPLELSTPLEAIKDDNTLTREITELITRGCHFVKYCKFTKQVRYVWVSPDLRSIYCKNASSFLDHYVTHAVREKTGQW